MTLKDILKRIFKGREGEPLVAHSFSQVGVSLPGDVAPPTYNERESMQKYAATHSPDGQAASANAAAKRP